MKNRLTGITAAIILLISCKTEKEISTSQTFFGDQKKAHTTSSFSGSTENSSNPAITSLQIKKELEANNIQYYPDKAIIPWREYQQSFTKPDKRLSDLALLYCKRNLIEIYEIYKDNLQLSEITSVLAIVKELTDRKYSGYKTLYNYLKWFKETGMFSTQWRAIQQKISTYAVVSKPDPTKHDSEILNQNPEFKAELLRIVEQLKERDSYIEKIRML